MPSVKAYVYDITGGMAKMMSMAMVGKQIDVVPHTGIVVFGKEYFFGAGPCIGEPGKSVPAQVAQVLDLGETGRTCEELETYIQQVLAAEHTAEKYSLLSHNCNHYADDVAKFLLDGKGLPEWIVNVAQEALSTDKGQQLRVIIEQADAMMRSAGGGGAPGGLNPYGGVGSSVGAGGAMGGSLNPYGGVNGAAAPTRAAEQAPAQAAGIGATHSEGLEDAMRELAAASVDERRACLQTLLKVTENLEKNPAELKFRKIKAENPAFSKKVLSCPGGTEALLAAGWEPTTHEGDDVWMIDEATSKQQAFFKQRFSAELAKLPAPPAPPAPAPPPPSAPVPAASSFGGDFGGLGGMGGLGGGMNPQMMQQMMNNPQMMAQAQQMMNNPQMMAQAQQMMNNPQMMAQMQQMMQNPQMMQQMQQMMGGMGGGF